MIREINISVLTYSLIKRLENIAKKPLKIELRIVQCQQMREFLVWFRKPRVA